MNKQIEDFETIYGNLAAQLGSENAAMLVSKSVMLIIIGSNDLIAYFKSNSQLPSKYTPQQFIDLMVSTFKAQVQVKILAFLGSHEFIALFIVLYHSTVYSLLLSILKAQVQVKLLAFLESHEFIDLFIPLNSI